MRDALPAEIANEPNAEPPDPDDTAWDEDGSTAGGDAQRRTIRRVLAGMGALILAALAVPIVVAVLHRQDPGVEVRYVIPAGTAERASGTHRTPKGQRLRERWADTVARSRSRS